MRSELLMRHIIEVVRRRKEHLAVVSAAEVFDSGRLGIGIVLAAYMIGHEVDNHLKTGLVAALYQGLEFFHSLGHIHGKVGVYVVVVGYGIRATGFSFYYVPVVTRYAICRIVGVVAMFNHTGIPHVSGAECFYRSEDVFVYVVQLSRAVLFECSVGYRSLAVIGKEAWKKLIYDRFEGSHRWIY